MSTRGGCHCGKVRYEFSADPLRIVHCFCTDCQKLTGTQMSTNLLVPRAAFRVTQGEPRHYANPGDSGKDVNRFFCGDCGAPLWGEPEVMPDMIVVKAGSLDDHSWLKPAASIYVRSAASWASIPEDTAHFDTMPG